MQRYIRSGPMRLVYWHVFSAHGFSQTVTKWGGTMLVKIQCMGLPFSVCFHNDMSPPQDISYPPILVLHPCRATLHHNTYTPVGKGVNNLQGGCSSVTTVCVWTAGHVPDQGYGLGLIRCWGSGCDLEVSCPRAHMSHPRCWWLGTALTLAPSRQGTSHQLLASGHHWLRWLRWLQVMQHVQICHTVLPQEPHWAMAVPGIPQQGSFLGNQGSKQISAIWKWSQPLAVTEAEGWALEHLLFVPVTVWLPLPTAAGGRCRLAFHVGRGFSFLLLLKWLALFHVWDVMWWFLR